MIISHRGVKLFHVVYIINPKRIRCISKYSNYLSSKAVRQKFLDFFIKENNYNFIKSSPVVPYHDATLPFVNAGMNQFKGIFLGTQQSKYDRVANSQKCIRAGGKHNDLDVIGKDGYHHTFFEMLGNWTFGECSKKESCSLAWKLLTEVYKINKRALYVTYFEGDPISGLQPDIECKEIWKSLGVPENRILPFGLKDNFWEMGLTGPCGPCTEIHYDHGGLGNRAEFVNKGLHELVEVWNIVFIEYKRDSDGTISPLPNKHVDTGMGFERLVAILQGKTSNYDTDIFRPILTAIHKNCTEIPKYRNYFGENDWDHLHTAYRILADHSRMITVCLSDGMIPEQNPKLRKVMRKVFAISENTFKKQNGFLKELSNYVIENLGSAYPELECNAKQVHQIIDFEEEIYYSLRNEASEEWNNIVVTNPNLEKLDVIEMPGLVRAYKEIASLKVNEISPEFGFKLFDTYGLDEDSITKLSKALNIKFNANEFRTQMDNVKANSKKLTNNATSLHLSDFNKIGIETNDSYKYNYKKDKNNYIFDDITVKVINIVDGAKLVDTVQPNMECSLILDQTNMYSEAGGQTSDLGQIKFKNGIFEIIDTKCYNKLILHQGVYKSDSNLSVYEKGVAKFDTEHRLAKMRNHTATHLLNAFVKQIKEVTCQKSSRVTDKYLNLDIAIFGEKLNLEDLMSIETGFKQIIKDSVEVKAYEIDSQKLLGLDKVTLLPGEVYPENGIRLIDINWKDRIFSREPCCGTHVLNTEDIEDFCIISSKSLGRSTVSLCAVTGERARLARKNSEELIEHIDNLQRNLDDNIDQPEILEMAVSNLKQQLTFLPDSDNILPAINKQECLDRLNSISKQIKVKLRNNLKEFIEMEMKSVLNNRVQKSKSNKDFVVHYLRTSMILEYVPLQRATQQCSHLPVLVISYSNNIVKARCCVPENFINDTFNAESWMKNISDVFNASVSPPKGQNSLNVCVMKNKKVTISDWHILLQNSLDAANNFAVRYL